MGSQRKVSLYSKLGWKPAALLLCNLDLCKIGQIQNAKSATGRLPPYTDPQYHCPLIFTLCQTDRGLPWSNSARHLFPLFLPSAEVWDCFFSAKNIFMSVSSIQKLRLHWKFTHKKKQMNSLYVITLLGLKPSKADGTKWDEIHSETKVKWSTPCLTGGAYALWHILVFSEVIRAPLQSLARWDSP